MAENKKIKKCPVSLQPDIENLLQDLTPDDFSPASGQEKEDFIQDRQSVSYWKDAWRRLKKNVVAMVALGVIIFLFLFAFVGPLLIPYGYDEFNNGAENLYPYHYTLEDQQRVDEEIASRTQSEVVDVDQMIEQAKAEAEAKGEKFTKKDEAILRAKAKTAAKNDTSAGSTKCSGCCYIFLLFELKYLSTDDTAHGYPVQKTERNEHGNQVRAKYIDKRFQRTAAR
jgi:oligopeptide transport system permease protein